MNIFLRCSLHFMCKKNSRWPNFSAIVSILGIAFGVLSFLTVVTILNAFQTQMKSLISSVNPNLTIFSPMGIPHIEQVEKEIETLIGSDIERMSPFVYQESILAHKQDTAGVYIRAITGTQSSSAQSLDNFILPQGALATLNVSSQVPDAKHEMTNNPNVILGKELSENLHAPIGSTVTLMTFETRAGGPPIVHYQKLHVSGILSVGLAHYDKSYMLMNFDDGVRLFGTQDWASGLEVKLKNPDRALALSTKLSQELPYSTIAWQEIDAGIFRQIARDGSTIQFIVFIISIVGGFNIMITLGLTVLDRTKQISLLRSLGARRRHIMGIFVGIGGILGFFGACLGIILSVLILFLLSKVPLGDLNQFYYLDKIPVHFNVSLMFSVFAVAIALSCLGALYPAWRATKVSPISGLNQ